ncbi:AMP-binding protein [Prauserella rugosa]|uniref:Long-chain acyl-CoA synthetase n=1 Tax=Prauserella rugosa TaxID=43354 RepID=A0A660CK92_9PSEU|nr:AMP-binding protein [Prauserella rugosa]TWH22043.1 long-chain acyl-CoA synthetase [Prauserella rugosa]
MTTDTSGPAAGNVADLVTTAARVCGDQDGVLDPSAGVSLTWAQTDRAVDAFARRLLRAGVEPGDRVALRLPTSAEFAVGLFATLRIGAVAVPLSPSAPDAETCTLVTSSGARVIIAHGAPEGSSVQALLPRVDGEVPQADGDPADPADPADPGTEGDTEDPADPADPAASTAEPVPPRAGGEDLAAIFYTSGTSGPARGVLLSHRALLANVEQFSAVLPPADDRDRALVAVPLHHIYGLGPGLLTSTARTAAVVLSQRFDARDTLHACRTHAITVVVGVPAMYTDLAARSSEELAEALSTVRLFLSGAAPLHPRVLTTISEATGTPVYEGYGLTEAAPVVTSTLVGGYAKAGSVGKPLPGVELRLVDSDGSAAHVPLDPADPDDAFGDDIGLTGLVAVRGANLFSGYWPDGDHGPDADGWYRTGDVGYLDADGDLHLVDRANDLIIVNGFNVYPREVEDVILTLPEVAEVAVVGALDERTGETVRAFVRPTPGASLSAQQVIDVCEQRLARYKVPSSVEFADELPHTSVGKLRRVQLRP